MLMQVSFRGDDVAQGDGSEPERDSLTFLVEAVGSIFRGRALEDLGI